MSNESVIRVKVASVNNNKINKKQDKIEEDKINNEMITDIINSLEELNEIQNNLLDRATKHDYFAISPVIRSKVLITKIKKILEIMTSKNLFNKSNNSSNVTINYYCQDTSQYPTPNMEGAHVEIAYRYTE